MPPVNQPAANWFQPFLLCSRNVTQGATFQESIFGGICNLDPHPEAAACMKPNAHLQGVIRKLAA